MTNFARKLLRFRLRTLLIVMAIIAGVIVVTEQSRQHRISTVERMIVEGNYRARVQGCAWDGAGKLRGYERERLVKAFDTYHQLAVRGAYADVHTFGEWPPPGSWLPLETESTIAILTNSLGFKPWLDYSSPRCLPAFYQFPLPTMSSRNVFGVPNTAAPTPLLESRDD